MFWWGIAIGFFLGGNFGVMIVALLKMNKN